MIDVATVVAALRHHGLDAWAKCLPAQYAEVMRARRHGDLKRWLAIVAALPDVHCVEVDLNRAAICARCVIDATTQKELEAGLRALHPWRKGPFELCGVKVDSEWRSDWKWQRLAGHIEPLAGRRVLDVGCGNGYYAWRMVGQGAGLVIGIDPTQLFVVQFIALRRYLGDRWPVHVLPLGIEEIPSNLAGFDTVFSMGVLAHRRSPIDHLYELKGALRRGGQLILETLVIEGRPGELLVPRHRYARMRNVWFIPSAPELEGWLRRVGFRHVHTVDVTPTSTSEQRSTVWMRFESLADHLQPEDAGRTIEGYPAPRRAVIIAER